MDTVSENNCFDKRISDINEKILSVPSKPISWLASYLIMTSMFPKDSAEKPI